MLKAQFIIPLFNKLYSKLSRFQKRWLLFFFDTCVLVAAIFVAFFTRLEFFSALTAFTTHWILVIAFILCQLLLLYLFGVYRSILFYSLNTVILKVFQALSCAFVIILIVTLFYRENLSLSFPLLIIIFDYFIAIFFICSYRFVIYSLTSIIKQSYQKEKQVIIFGAGITGSKLFQFIRDEETVAAFIDDNVALRGQTINGVTIYQLKEIKSLLAKKKISKLIIAVPAITKQRLLEIFEFFKPYPFFIQTVTKNYSPLRESSLSVRNMTIEDLIGRTEIQPKQELLEKSITGQTVAITGAGGSIGKAICKVVLKHSPKLVILIENNEFSLYEVENFFKDRGMKNYKSYLCSILSDDRLTEIFSNNSIDVIYHCAAYKHVNLVEANPVEGVLVNIFGTFKLLKKFIKYKCSKFVLISTDKAVNPTSIMGQTKKAAELILRSFSVNQPDKVFTIVRFGNVIYSSGSVIPRFEKLLREKKDLVVSHKNATRYFMSLSEAASLVIQASSLAKSNEIFHLDMGSPIKIYDLAYNLIRLHGQVPNKSIAIKIGELKPGEKIVEEDLIIPNKSQATEHPKIYKVKEEQVPRAILDEKLTKMFYFAKSNDRDSVRRILKDIIFQEQLHQNMFKNRN